MKRFFLPCVLLLILLFSSCSLLSPQGAGESAPASENSETAAPEELEPLSPGLYELFRFDNNGKGENFSSMAVHGGEAVVYASRYDPAAKDGLAAAPYIFSGAVTPMMPSESAMTRRTQSASRRRASSTFSSAPLMRQAV